MALQKEGIQILVLMQPAGCILRCQLDLQAKGGSVPPSGVCRYARGRRLD